ncbi:hypothetical protein ON010_g14876 [Phytophthora cinnamomi]|nr:hypothetical protein ON010_g14876 [Phytophthora cinnamomi]
MGRVAKEAQLCGFEPQRALPPEVVPIGRRPGETDAQTEAGAAQGVLPDTDRRALQRAVGGHPCRNQSNSALKLDRLLVPVVSDNTKIMGDSSSGVLVHAAPSRALTTSRSCQGQSYRLERLATYPIERRMGLF